jgi:hypothetical protein
MEVLAKRAITPRVSGIPGTPFVSILLATYKGYHGDIEVPG